MSTNLNTPVLLRRIAQLEVAVGRLSDDLTILRSAVDKQGLRLPRVRGVRTRLANTKSSATDSHDTQATGGLAGAIARGEHTWGPGLCGHYARGAGFCETCVQAEIDRRAVERE